MHAISILCLLLSSPGASELPLAAAHAERAAYAHGSSENDDTDAAGCRTMSGADSIWLVSSRHVGCGCGQPTCWDDFYFQRYTPDSEWRCADAEQWAASGQTAAMTLVYVHGNRIEPDEAAQRGLSAWHALSYDCGDIPRVRFVIWSWPSSKIHGPRPRRDAQVKAARTDCESCLLAQFVAGVDPRTSLSLLGYSFGARIVSGALHLTAGGQLHGFRLADADIRRDNTIRVALLAAAMDNSWWRPGSCHDQALAAVDQLLLLYNTCDPVLRLYPKLDRHHPASALGYTGFPWPAALIDNAWRVEQANVCCQIGKTHDERAYSGCPLVMARVRAVLLGLPQPASGRHTSPEVLSEANRSAMRTEDVALHARCASDD